MTERQALELLRQATGNPHARFRPGQWEAIDAVAHRKEKMLVVQRTGWGKSSVYFISARILRNEGSGPIVIISPLLALMRNQIEAASRLGIRAATINSTNMAQWDQVKQEILDDRVDAVIVSPERLASDDFIRTVLEPIADRLGLLVVDEAHCISDWGHDFRPDYRRISTILGFLPENTPLLCTTATANNRVVEDIRDQLGNISILRGPLVRESLSLQNIVLPDQGARLAWMAEFIPKMEGTGIVYVLTKRDARLVAGWLRENGIDAEAYYSGVNHPGFEDENAYRQHLEEELL